MQILHHHLNTVHIIVCQAKDTPIHRCNLPLKPIAGFNITLNQSVAAPNPLPIINKGIECLLLLIGIFTGSIPEYTFAIKKEFINLQSQFPGSPRLPVMRIYSHIEFITHLQHFRRASPETPDQFTLHHPCRVLK